jgi:endonuclease/exonuclease/phosphatase family metal-dependent hydrolase
MKDAARTSRRQQRLDRVHAFSAMLAQHMARIGRPAAPQGAPPAPGALRIASYNIHKCVGTDSRFDPARVAAVIAELDADLVALQEADRRFGRREGTLDLAALARDTGLVAVPVAMAPRSHGWHGNALLARGASVLGVQRLRLPGGEPRGAVAADLAFPAGRLRVVAVHLGLLRRHRMQQVKALLDHLAQQEEDAPTLLMGDLNEWRVGPRSALRPLERSFEGIDPGPPTFPSRLPVLGLDRILCAPRGILGGVAAHHSPLARVASDHLPLTAWIDLAAAPVAALAPAA